MFATVVRARQAQVVSQEIAERAANLDSVLDAAPVDFAAECFFIHGVLSFAISED
jgi:hypothetical protein